MPPSSASRHSRDVRHVAFLLDVQGHILACSTQQPSMHADSKALLGRSFASLCEANPSGREQWAVAMDSAAQGDRCFLTGVELQLQGESHSRANLSLEALRTAEGRLQGFFVDVCDRPGSRDAEQRLRESERRFRLFVNAVADHAICMLDAEGFILDWNLGVQRMTRLGLPSVDRQHYEVLFSDGERERHQPRRLLERAAHAGKVEYETELMREGGEAFPACLTLEAVQDSRSELIGFACIIRDVTRERQMEQRLIEAQEQLARIQKAEAIGQLTGGIAHDFNNALQGIISSLEIAAVYLERQTPEKTAHYLAVALEAAKRSGSLTQRLLGMARQQSAVHQRADVNGLLASLKTVLGSLLGDGIALEFDVEADLPTVACNTGQLESALLNLAINARDAMDGRGRLVIRARSCRGTTSATAAPSAAHIEIAMIDDGKGMDEEVLRRACEPFFTTKGHARGTGLGLSMVAGFVAQHGGSMDIDSAPGRGTRVTLRLPCDTEGARSGSEEERQAPPELDGLRVLLVENDATVGQSIAARLQQLGCHVVVATRGREALLALRTGSSWDLLLSDIDLPELDGYELCRHARMRFPQLRVVLMTGHLDVAPPADDERGMVDVLIKPFDMGALLTKVRMLLQSH